MANSTSPKNTERNPSRNIRANKRYQWLAIFLGVTIIFGGVVLFGSLKPLPVSISSSPASSQLQVESIEKQVPDFVSPFLNTKLDVGYVGDSGCSKCHSEIEKTYRQHPMGQSATTDWNDPSIRDLLKKEATFKAFDDKAEFQTSLVDDKLVHKIAVMDASGKPKAVQAVEATICIGSGNHARTFLCDREGSLWESPMTYFKRADQWRISPGYQLGLMFSRQVTKECLYCHVDRWEPMARGSDIKKADFTGHASIGCERCHGPGDLHVKAREGTVVSAGVDGNDSAIPLTNKSGLLVNTAGGAKTSISDSSNLGINESEPTKNEIDYTIVNPKHLTSVLQDSICEQCHLQGEARVVRPGKDQFDFRPGMPREQYWSVFVTQDWEKHLKVAGQVEQMVASQCWKKSEGKLLCTSCHDPHVKPSEEIRVSFYRDKCNACHQDRKECAIALEVRESKNANDCSECHMPAREMDDVSHASFHDHRVLRVHNAGATGESEVVQPILELLAGGPGGLIPFSPTTYLPSKQAINRDRGIAMINILGGSGTGDVKKRDAIETHAYPLLAKALEDNPDDAEAAMAISKLLADRNPAASKFAAEVVLAKSPESEGALSLAVYACVVAKDWVNARKYAERITAVIPSSPEGYQWLGNIAMQFRDPPEAERWFRKAIEAHAMMRESRVGLAAALFAQNKKDESSSEMEFLNNLFPNQQAVFKSLFGQLVETASGQIKSP